MSAVCPVSIFIPPQSVKDKFTFYENICQLDSGIQALFFDGPVGYIYIKS